MTAPTPVFQPDLLTLQKELRLDGVNPDSGAYSAFEAAVRDARVEFWRELGASRVVQLQGFDSKPDPGTEEEHLRALAEITESKIVRKNLLEVLAVKFKEGSSDLEEWNDVGAFRGASSFDRDRELKALRIAIAQNFDMLRGVETAGNETGMRTLSVGAAAGPQSVYGRAFS